MESVNEISYEMRVYLAGFMFRSRARVSVLALAND
jgi:hypothetical protein